MNNLHWIDWVVLCGSLLFIVLYGTWKTRGSKNIEGYLRGDNTQRWWMMGVSIMATQASAVTFLSTPGQAFQDGMRFLQFYFGLPLAIVIIAVTMVPIYYRLKVYTAYEYLERRFDLKTRILGATLFLLLRGLSAGITLYAPALVLSTILQWNVLGTTFLMGGLVIIYVVAGGTKAVSLTQRQQMAVIFVGMFLAGVIAVYMLPDHVSFPNAVDLAGELGKFNLINTHFDPDDRYNIWSGLFASTFLFLSYFGTDQSQVARYLGGKSIRESRMGLIFNGLLKIPMQFLILFIGVMVYVFYLFYQPPVFFNAHLKDRAMQTTYADSLQRFDHAYDSLYKAKRHVVDALVTGLQQHDAMAVAQARASFQQAYTQEHALRGEVKTYIGRAVPGASTEDGDYIFLHFVMNNLPAGIVGLLLAVMFSAAMSSCASELNALASTTTIDLYQRLMQRVRSARHYLNASRWFTVLWALLAMMFAVFANFAENLIQFVNIIGSLFYGTILGIFLTAFYLQRVGGTAVFIAAIVAEGVVLYCFFYTELAYLFYNVIACLVVTAGGWCLQLAFGAGARAKQ